MRILFIRPQSGFYINFSPEPPLGSLALASFLQSRGHTVRIFDQEVERSLKKAVKEFQPDAAAVTLLSSSMIPDAMQISRALKAMGLPVFWGGHMASAVPELVARSGCADYVGISEGEYTLLELLEVVQGKRAPESVLGIAYVDRNGEYHRTADRPFADLADFPPLDYSLIPLERFITRDLPQCGKRQFLILSSKGCPASCSFCFNSEFHRCQRRVFPREVIFRQVKTLAEDYKIDGLAFWDECFGVNKQELRAFCQGMKAMNLNMAWFAETMIGVLSREELEMMYDAGCRVLGFGLESGSAEMRRKIRKTYDASKIDETRRNCREAGILAWGMFIIGLPDETPEQLRATVRLCLALQLDLYTLSFYTPVPGSQLYRELVTNGRLDPSKTLEAIAQHSMARQHLFQNFSCVPDKDLQVIQKFFHWQLAFGKKQKIVGIKRSPAILTAIGNLFRYLRNAGLRGLARGLWDSLNLFCTVAWYAHAYPSIRKKYDLYAKNFGRTAWE